MFDWYVEYDQIRKIMMKQKKKAKVLHVGCGNSGFSASIYYLLYVRAFISCVLSVEIGEHMAADGFLDITNIDISDVLIDSMKTKYQATKSLKWACMDACHQKFEAETFDVTLEKG